MTTNLRGAALMVIAMGLFAVEDMLIKILSYDLPTGQILAILGLGGAVAFAALLRARGQPVWTAAMRHPAAIGRTLAEAIGTVGFVTALALTPLVSASAILQAVPLAVTLGAVLFLGETVGWRRWSAIGAGFAGVLLILRPGLDSFEPASLFAVIGVIGLGSRDLLVRMVPPDTRSDQLSFMAFLALVPTGLALTWATGQAAVMPDLQVWATALATIVLGVVAYAAIIAATRTGDVAAVTPFRYSRIGFALVIGVWVFGERPDAATLTGAAIIVASGVFTLLREARIGRGPATASLATPPKL